MEMADLCAGNGNAALATRNLNTDERALQRHRGPPPIDVRIALRMGEPLFGALLGSLGAFDVDLSRAFRHFREHSDAFTQNFREAADDRDRIGLRTALRAIRQLADAQLGDQRSVARQNAQLAVGAGKRHLGDGLAEQLPFRRDDDQLDGVSSHFLSVILSSSQTDSRLRVRLHLLGLFERFLDGADHVERLLRNVIVLAFDDFLEAANRVFNLDVFAFEAGELRCDEHRLRQESLNLTRAGYGALVFVRKFFDAENGDDVLQVFVALENRLHGARHGVMLLPDDARIENARITGQWINGRINAAFDDLTAEVRRRVQVSERRGWRRVGVVVGRHVNRLHRRDRTRLRGSDALLEFADFGVEVRLITDGAGHAAEKRGNFGTGLNETENIVDEEQHVEMFFVAEIFGDGETGQTDAQTQSGRLGHLSVDQRGARFFGIAGDDDAAFRHFKPEVVAFTGAFADTGEHRHAAVLHRDVVNQFHNQNGFADAGAAEESNLSALEVRLDQIDDFDSGLEHFERRGLIFEARSGTVNRVVLVAFDGAKLIDGLAEHVHHTAEGRATDRNGDTCAGVVRLHAADHAFGRLHGDCAHAAVAEVLLHFDDDVERLGDVVSFARDANRVENGWWVSRFEFN